MFDHFLAYGTTKNETNPVHDEITLRREEGKVWRNESIAINEARESAALGAFFNKRRFSKPQILRRRCRASRDKIAIAQITLKQK